MCSAITFVSFSVSLTLLVIFIFHINTVSAITDSDLLGQYSNEQGGGWQQYRNADLGFSIAYPSDWNVKDNGQTYNGGRSISFSPSDRGVTMVAVVATSLENAGSLKRYIFDRMGDNPQIMSHKVTEIDTHLANLVHYLDAAGLESTGIFTQIGNTIWDISFFDHPSDYNKNEPIALQMINSFKLLGQ